MRDLCDEVEVWVNDVIQHTTDIPSLNKSKEHLDPLNPLGDQELNIPRPYRPPNRKRKMSGHESSQKKPSTRQSPRLYPLEAASIPYLPPESTGSHSGSSRGRSPRKRSPAKLLPAKGHDQQLSDCFSDCFSDYTLESSLQSRSKSSKSPTHGNRNMAHLEICNPTILLKTVEDCKKEIEGQLPQRVQVLVNHLYYDAPSGFIPLQLKVSKVSVARYTP